MEEFPLILFDNQPLYEKGFISCFLSVDPSIVDDFFAGRTTPETVVTSVSSGPPPLLTPLVEVGVPAFDIYPGFQPTTQATVGCKAEGRPRASITWYRMVRGGAREQLNNSQLDVNITSAREGQSILTVALSSSNTNCYLYICVAENGGAPVEGSAEVCPIRKTEVFIIEACS